MTDSQTSDQAIEQTATASTTGKPVRRSQADRRADTRQRILQATLAQLMQSGYAGLTTQAVCKRAGVSKGAMFDHFPSKQALIVAANEASNEHLRADALQTLTALVDAPDRLRATVDYLWKIYASPTVIALTEVHMAARTDPALLAALDDVADAHRDATLLLAQTLFPAKSTQQEFMRAVEVGLSAIMGGAVLFHTGSASADTDAVLTFLTMLIRPYIEDQQ
ncbi:MAG: TetR/AcrR family transcriptional regulator [Alphaproteobacteria bacterium]